MYLKIHRIGAAAAVAIALGLPGCSSYTKATNPSSTNNLPKVVATHSVLCDLTKAIAQNTIDFTCLIKPGEDAHVYKATPKDRKAIEKAQLVFYGGYNFEPGLLKIIQASNNSASKIAVHEVAVPQPILAQEHDHEDAGKKNSASEEKTPDPHIWHNAENGDRMVEVISRQLTKVAPGNSKLYASNAKQLSAQLKQVDTWIKAQINTIPAKQRKLVTTHDALNYYANAYGLTIEGALQGLSTDEKPTAARVKELVTEIKQAGVPTIFIEVTANDKVIKTVAKEAGVKVADQKLFVDGLGEPGSQGDTYIGMLTNNTCTIVEGLGGKCTPFVNKKN